LGLRLLLALVTLELSGLAHAGADAYQAAAGFAQHDQDCDDEEAGHECPPGCPNCHCVHAALVLAQPRCGETQLEALPPREQASGGVPSTDRVPAPQDPDSIYRPPRAQA
jgi:hypothetical protein